MGGIAGFAIDLLLSVVLLAAFVMIGGVLWGVLQGLRGVPVEMDAGSDAMIANTLVGTGLGALTVYLLRRRATREECAASWRALWRKSTWLAILVALLATTGFSMLVGLLAQQLQVEMTPSNLVLSEAVAKHPFLLLIFAVLIAPAYEELLFRRVLFGRLWAAGRPGLGLTLSSIAFALVHEPPGLGASQGWNMLMLWAVYAFMGAVFAATYRRTGTLWAAFAVHALNNLVAGTALFASL